MRDEIADLVYPVIACAVARREALGRGEAPELDAVQSELRGLLKPEGEARRWPDYGGDGAEFLGVRYALACLLDELFTDSPWRASWRERKLEESLFGTNDRAWKFWHQAGLAQRRPGIDAVEGFYLCVLLGFRGQGPEPPQNLQGWRDTVQARLTKAQDESWPAPPDQPLQLHPEPLTGRARLRKAQLALVVALALWVPLLAFTAVSQLAQ
jgi:type VI secretion system protein ImpK